MKMDPLDQDLARLATAPVPPALAGLETALWARLDWSDPGLGWPARGALAAACLTIGLAMGGTGSLAAGPGTAPIDAFSSRSALLPSTLLLSARP
ncbi:hypothetical protein CAP39_09895 [Sphingomonas sp. IBVSS1]|nr:hypothetical protein CAP39_09895 [Sphingomonas sp. IBVSS1]